MSTGDGFERCGSRVPEQVHRHTEETPKQIIAAGDVARAMWPLLVAERSHHPISEPEQLAPWVIDTSRRQHDTTPDVYAMAAYAAALAITASSDSAALVLINLASLHEHVGYPGDALLLIDVCDTDEVSERVRRALATARACTGRAEHRPESRPVTRTEGR